MYSYGHLPPKNRFGPGTHDITHRFGSICTLLA